MSSQVAHAHALQQALVAAARNPDERGRAINLFRGAEMFAATWPTDATQIRTLMNSAGVRALSLFTDEAQLEEAALRFGWLGVDGRVPLRTLHVSEAVRFARQHHVALIIIDISADHALELDQGDMELLSAPPSVRPPAFGAVTPVVSSTRQADSGSEVKRISTRPPAFSKSGEETATHASPSGLVPAAINVDVEHQAVWAAFTPASVTTMIALATPPDDELTDALSSVLRDFCEVQWACFVGDADRAGSSRFSVALRVDPGFHKHLAEISTKLRRTCVVSGVEACDVLVLETVEQMKRARHLGLPFYPWRKR